MTHACLRHSLRPERGAWHLAPAGLGRGAVTRITAFSAGPQLSTCAAVRVEGALRPATPPPAVPASLVRPRPEPRYARHPAPRSVRRTVWLDQDDAQPSRSLSSFNDLATPLGALAVLR